MAAIMVTSKAFVPQILAPSPHYYFAYLLQVVIVRCHCKEDELQDPPRARGSETFTKLMNRLMDLLEVCTTCGLRFEMICR
jgi:hypothetical protein